MKTTHPRAIPERPCRWSYQCTVIALVSLSAVPGCKWGVTTRCAEAVHVVDMSVFLQSDFFCPCAVETSLSSDIPKLQWQPESWISMLEAPDYIHIIRLSRPAQVASQKLARLARLNPPPAASSGTNFSGQRSEVPALLLLLASFQSIQVEPVKWALKYKMRWNQTVSNS